MKTIIIISNLLFLYFANSIFNNNIINQMQKENNDSIIFFEMIKKIDTLELPVKFNHFQNNIIGYTSPNELKFKDEYFIFFNIKNENLNDKYYLQNIIEINDSLNFYILSYLLVNFAERVEKIYLITIDKKTFRKISSIEICSLLDRYVMSNLYENFEIDVKEVVVKKRLLIKDYDIYDLISETNFKYKILESGKITLLNKEFTGEFIAKQNINNINYDCENMYIYPVELPKE